jgi:hypothetical protein
MRFAPFQANTDKAGAISAPVASACAVFSANSTPKARKQGQFSSAPRAMLFPNSFFKEVTS